MLARPIGAPMGTSEDIVIQKQLEADYIARQAKAPQVNHGFPANWATVRVSDVYVDPKLTASREQAARLAVHERAVNAHNVTVVRTKNEKVAFKKRVILKPLTESGVDPGWINLVGGVGRVGQQHAKFANQDWLDVAALARQTAEILIDPPLTEIEAGIIAQFAYAQVPPLYLGDANAWIVSFDCLKALGIIRENEVDDTPQLEAAPVVVNDNEFPYSSDPHSDYAIRDRQIRAEEASKEAVAVGLTNPALAQNVQQVRVPLGVQIDPEDDKLSADEYAAKHRIGSSVLRANATHGTTYTGNERKGA